MEPPGIASTRVNCSDKRDPKECWWFIAISAYLRDSYSWSFCGSPPGIGARMHTARRAQCGKERNVEKVVRDCYGYLYALRNLAVANIKLYAGCKKESVWRGYGWSESENSACTVDSRCLRARHCKKEWAKFPAASSKDPLSCDPYNEHQTASVCCPHGPGGS